MSWEDGCGAHGCVIKKPIGQGTNGGCICSGTALRLYIHKLKRQAKDYQKHSRMSYSDFCTPD